MTDIKTVFLDRDGVINPKRAEGDYVKRWEEFEFLPRAKEALRLLCQAGLRLIIITNQRGIARGLMTEADLRKIHQQMLDELAEVGVRIDALYCCPHEGGECSCRKPQIGLFLQAQEDFPGIDFSRSVVIGDSLADMEAGARLGHQVFLIADPLHKDKMVEDARAGDIPIDGVAQSLFDAVVQYVLVA